MVPITLGDGVVADVVRNKAKGNNGGWIVISAGWAFAVAVAVYLVNVNSGAHLNPAVTIGLAQMPALEAVRGKPARLVIDLDAIDYISSAGLRVLLLAAKESRGIGVVCVLCGLRAPVLKLFETTGLIKIITILPNRMAALAAI